MDIDHLIDGVEEPMTIGQGIAPMLARDHDDIDIAAMIVDRGIDAISQLMDATDWPGSMPEKVKIIMCGSAMRVNPDEEETMVRFAPIQDLAGVVTLAAIWDFTADMTVEDLVMQVQAITYRQRDALWMTWGEEMRQDHIDIFETLCQPRGADAQTDEDKAA